MPKKTTVQFSVGERVLKNSAELNCESYFFSDRYLCFVISEDTKYFRDDKITCDVVHITEESGQINKYNRASARVLHRTISTYKPFNKMIDNTSVSHHINH